MGHDIFGFNDKQRNKKISYLRYSAGQEQARYIYRALDAEEHDCGCSGCGETVFFTKQKLRHAIMKFSAEKHEQEHQFLRDLIEKGSAKGAWISFH